MSAGPPIPPPLPPGRVVTVPGRGEMFIREDGLSEPPILLLHGWTLSSDLNWFSQYGAVARRGRLLAVDQRGHGRGLRSAEPFTLEGAADDAAALLEHLDMAPAVVVGYSMGGSIALLLWLRHPHLVSGLVLQATALHWRSTLGDRMLWSSMWAVEYVMRFGNPRGMVERYLRHAVEQNRALVPYESWLQGEARRGDPADIAAAGRAISAFDARSFAADVDVPTAVVVTGRDHLVQPAQQRALAAAIPGAHVIEADTAHNGWLVRPRRFAASTDQALAAVIGASPAESAPPRQVARLTAPRVLGDDGASLLGPAI